MRARVFLRDPEFRYAGELDAADADDVWRQLQLEPPATGRSLRSGDIVYTRTGMTSSTAMAVGLR
jgi:hypothetical protein